MELRLEARNLIFGNRTDAASEANLIDRCRKQDVEAFGRFVDLYQSRVLGFVRRMVPSVEEAQDITQEVFIRAFQSFARFDSRSSVKTWLFRIAHNLCIDRSRKVKRSFSESSLFGGNEGDEVIEIADERWEPEKVIMDTELSQVVDEAISQMSEKLRGVLVLHDREELPYEEIAKVLDVPIGTVKSRLFLARAYLQKSLYQYIYGEEALDR